MIPLHGPYTACAYICTEDVFPHRRLMQLAEAFAEEHKSLGHSAKTYTDNVMLAHSATVVSVWLAALCQWGRLTPAVYKCDGTCMCLSLSYSVCSKGLSG